MTGSRILTLAFTALLAAAPAAAAQAPPRAPLVRADLHGTLGWLSAEGNRPEGQRGTLMDATAERLVLQPRTRIPERPVEISIDRVLAIELETSNGSVARTVGVAVAAATGAFSA